MDHYPLLWQALHKLMYNSFKSAAMLMQATPSYRRHC